MPERKVPKEMHPLANRSAVNFFRPAQPTTLSASLRSRSVNAKSRLNGLNKISAFAGIALFYSLMGSQMGFESKYQNRSRYIDRVIYNFIFGISAVQKLFTHLKCQLIKESLAFLLQVFYGHILLRLLTN
jgi:hypothetical protein